MFRLLLLFTGILSDPHNISPTIDPSSDLISKKMFEAKQFCRTNGYDTTTCFLLDLSIHNGRKRFFVCDIQRSQIMNSGLVTHGHCGTPYLSNVLYSNQPGCGCSSAGKYKVGNFYKGRFGDAYKLHGLDASNSNAYSRFIVLHSHSCVPDTEIYPNQICNSEGCTTVSPAFLKELERIISSRKRPILLWVIQ
ncbi:MAG: murein L,D-transpeptidase catalytic domain family protein [Bacteroidota bacterium]